MANQKALEKLYLIINDQAIPDNPFETSDFRDMWDHFFKTHVEIEENSLDKQNEMFELIDAMINIDRETAFKVGFKTAVELMMGGCKNG